MDFGSILAEWNGFDLIRSKLVSSGFRTISAYSEIYGKYDNTGRSAVQLIAEWNDDAVARLSSLKRGAPIVRPAPSGDRATTFTSDTLREFNEELYRARFAEFHLVSDYTNSPADKSKDVRRLTEAIAAKQGFSVANKFGAFAERTIYKRVRSLGIVGCVSIDGRARRLGRFIGLPINFYVGKYPDADPWIFGFMPAEIIPELSCYNQTSRNIRLPSGLYRPSFTIDDPVENEIGANLTKLGLLAYVTFFDFFLESLSA